MHFPHLGFCAFADGTPYTNESYWASYVRVLLGIGYDHLQFLMPENEAQARTINKIARESGLTGMHVLACTFGDACPMRKNNLALAQFGQFFDLMGILTDGFDDSSLFGPCFFRALGDPRKGLVEPDDVSKQADFLSRVVRLWETKGLPQMGLVAEPLARNESLGPNTLRAAWDIIVKSGATGQITLGADTHHVAWGAKKPVAQELVDFTAQLGRACHLSANDRCDFTGNLLLRETLRGIARSRSLVEKRIWSVEAFCKATNPGFFDFLQIHYVPDCTAAQLATACMAAITQAML